MNDWPELGARDRPTIVGLAPVQPDRRQGADRLAAVAQPWLASDPASDAARPAYRAAPRRRRTVRAADRPGRSSRRLIDASGERAVPLRPMSDRRFPWRLHWRCWPTAGAPSTSTRAPNEVDPAIPFAEDVKRAPTTATAPSALHGALLAADRVFELFRSGFLGKVSPVHFFWGSFDLAVTRFSGRAGAAPPWRHPQPSRRGDARGL